MEIRLCQVSGRMVMGSYSLDYQSSVSVATHLTQLSYYLSLVNPPKNLFHAHIRIHFLHQRFQRRSYFFHPDHHSNFEPHEFTVVIGLLLKM